MKRLIAEFEPQSFTQIIFPHAKTDWVEYLDEAEKNFIEIIHAIIKYQKCLVVCADMEYVKTKFNPHPNLFFVEYEGDDTWARDCSVVCVQDGDDIKLLDFTFDGWGGKFEASKDNAMSKNLAKYYDKRVLSLDFILEGGAIESNGDGLILSTAKCMSSRGNFKGTTKVVAPRGSDTNNKNNGGTVLTVLDTTKVLAPRGSDTDYKNNGGTVLTVLDTTKTTIKKHLGAKEVLLLNHGYLAGDDTDSHIDTLARFCDKKTIMYIKCKDKDDEHYKELKLMEDELKVLAQKYNLKLIPLPFTHAIHYDNERLPATYANFLFVNGAVLVPTYGVDEDEEALNIFRKTFDKRDVIAIDCSTLIRQHGSLHCVTMNFSYDVCLKLDPESSSG